MNRSGALQRRRPQESFTTSLAGGKDWFSSYSLLKYFVLLYNSSQLGLNTCLLNVHLPLDNELNEGRKPVHGVHPHPQSLCSRGHRARSGTALRGLCTHQQLLSEEREERPPLCSCGVSRVSRAEIQNKRTICNKSTNSNKCTKLSLV